MASIWSRKLDLLYVVFFLIHISAMFAVDLYQFYPPSFRPEWMIQLRSYYIANYKDRFFTAPPAWFSLYMWLELLYHVPISLWAIGALVRDDPRVPLHLLVFALETAITTMTCIAEYMSWAEHSSDEKLRLGSVYAPYFAFSVFMSVDMFSRISRSLSKASQAKAKTS